LQISTLETKWEVQNQNEFVIYNTVKNTLITERKGDKVTLFSKDSLLKNKKNTLLSSYLSGNFSTLESKKKLKNLIYFNGKKILIIDSSAIYIKTNNPDIVLLTQSSKINLDRLLQKMKPKVVIADGSNYKTIQKRWEATCNKQKIPFHATSEKGFYKIN
jgi:competence protein ComEC